MEREALIRFLVDKIRGELALSGDAVARSDREGCFHRAAAYAIVLLQLDREQADTWRRQIEEARGVTGGQAGPGGRE